MDPSDALLAARDLLRERGWTKHTYRDEKGRRCLSGALGGVGHSGHFQFLPETRGPLRREIQDRYGDTSVAECNDYIIRDLDEACDVLEAAAKRAAEESG